MERYGKMDKIVFQEFYNNREKLHQLARVIREATSDEDQNMALYNVREEDDATIEVWEGQVIYKLHKLRERHNKINKRKKEWALDSFGRLECEACTFDFEKFYHKLGKGYVECHHRTPLSELETEQKTKLDDLALVCSNCHRMLHREISTLSVDELKWRIGGSVQSYYNF